MLLRLNRQLIGQKHWVRYAHLGRDSDVKAIELYHRVTSNTRVNKALQETANVLITKGFTQPILSPQQQFRLLNDREIVAKMDNFKRVLDEEQIKFDLTDISNFLKFFTSDKYIIEN